MFWIGMLVGMIVAVLVLVAAGIFVWRKILGVTSMDEYDGIFDAIFYACENRESTIAVVPHDATLEVKELVLEKR